MEFTGGEKGTERILSSFLGQPPAPERRLQPEGLRRAEGSLLASETACAVNRDPPCGFGNRLDHGVVTGGLVKDRIAAVPRIQGVVNHRADGATSVSWHDENRAKTPTRVNNHPRPLLYRPLLSLPST